MNSHFRFVVDLKFFFAFFRSIRRENEIIGSELGESRAGRFSTDETNSFIAEPGGYIQWGEYSQAATKTLKTDPSLSSSGVDGILKFTREMNKADGRIGIKEYVRSSFRVFLSRSLFPHPCLPSDQS